MQCERVDGQGMMWRTLIEGNGIRGPLTRGDIRSGDYEARWLP